MGMSFLRADGSLPENATTAGRPRWTAWLPAWRQIVAALQLDLGGDTTHLTMRQGLGLVVLAALLAGLLPSVLAWVMATRAGVIAPLAALAQRTIDPGVPGPWDEIWRTARTIAVLPPAVLPGWLAALLSALGGWINWPLRWLAWWIVYGTGVLVCAKGFGTAATLPQLFRATGYAAVPLVLLGFSPIPYVGAVATAVSLVWMALVYVAGVRAATRLELGPALVAVLLPGGIAALLSLLAVLSVVASFVRLAFT
jgi:hypothetical protein